MTPTTTPTTTLTPTPSPVETSLSWKSIQRKITYLGSKGASDRGFIESLHSDLNTRNASFWVTWENLTAPDDWLLTEVDEELPSTSVPDSLWVSPSSSDIGDDVSVGVEGGSPFTAGTCGVVLETSPFERILWSGERYKALDPPSNKTFM